MPLRTEIEGRRFQQAKLQAAAHALRLVAETRKAYINAIAASQAASFMEQAGTAAEAGAELAQRMARIGNASRLDYAREKAFHAEAVAQIARARRHAVAAREALVRQLGLNDDEMLAMLRLPPRLPDLPDAPKAMPDIESQAMQYRLDVQMARRDAEASARALGLTKVSGFINVLDAGYINKSETGQPRANGYEVQLELPLFDWGDAKVAKAEAIYMQSVQHAANIAVRARSDVRNTYFAYRTAFDLARHYRDEVLPLRKKISDEMLLRYNGMLIGVFELLADAREQINSVNAAIEAQRDYWNADAALDMAINGVGADSAAMMNSPASTAATTD
jgi:outer membrane protein TolC